MFAARTVIKRTLATATIKSAATTTASSSSSRWMASLVGVAVLVPVVTLAPANTFDDLDCLSHCQRKLVEDIPQK